MSHCHTALKRFNDIVTITAVIAIAFKDFIVCDRGFSRVIFTAMRLYKNSK